MYAIWVTLERAALDIALFFVTFFMLLYGFCQCGHQLFGSILMQYSTSYRSLVALLLTVLGDFDVDSLIQASPQYGMSFFMAFQLMMFFVMVNVFLAIINDSYAQVMSDVGKEKAYEDWR